MVNILLSNYNFHEKWAKTSVQKYIDTNDKVVVIPFAFSEEGISNNTDWHNAYDKHHGKYYKEVVEPFIDLGINEDNITWLNYFKDTDDEMKEIIESSNIVFLTGGFPEKAIERVIEKDLLTSLNNSKIIIGASAGALMQLNNYFISPDEDYPEFMYYQGLGLISNDFYIDVHYKNTDIQNDCIKRALTEKTNIIYAITNNGGIIIDNGALLLLGDVVTLNS